jgi:hypothetical protein
MVAAAKDLCSALPQKHIRNWDQLLYIEPLPRLGIAQKNLRRACRATDVANH